MQIGKTHLYFHQVKIQLGEACLNNPLDVVAHINFSQLT